MGALLHRIRSKFKGVTPRPTSLIVADVKFFVLHSIELANYLRIMMDDTKLLLGKLLAEVYRLQVNSNIPCSAGPDRIYGLLNGIEMEINGEIEGIGFISNEQVQAASRILDKIFMDDAKLAQFKGFYDIESDLENAGVDRVAAMKIFTYFAAAGRFTSILEKMNSNNSPIECKTFELNKWEQ